MPTGCLDLADLLTASGEAMGRSNQRLLRSGAPALLQEFDMELRFQARFCLSDGCPTVLFDRINRSSAQMQAMNGNGSPNVTITAHYIAAPSLRGQPPPVESGGCP